MDTDVVLILAIGGGVGAYFLVPDFKKAIDDALGGVGVGGGGCNEIQKGACDTTKGQSQSQKIAAGKVVITAFCMAYKNGAAATQAQGTTLLNKVTTTDALAVINATIAVCNSGCSMSSRQALYNTARTLVVKYSKSMGWTTKMPVTMPQTTNQAITNAKIMLTGTSVQMTASNDPAGDHY